MNRNTLAKDQATMFTVDGNPMPLCLPIGSAIFVYLGQVWITQEGMHEDVVLGPGERFDVRSGALILASGSGATRTSTSLARRRRLSMPILMCTRICVGALDGCAPRNSIKWSEPSATGCRMR